MCSGVALSWWKIECPERTLHQGSDMDPHAPVLFWVLRSAGARLWRLSCKPSKLEAIRSAQHPCQVASWRLQYGWILWSSSCSWTCLNWIGLAVLLEAWSSTLATAWNIPCCPCAQLKKVQSSGTSGELVAVETDSMASSVAVMPTSNGAVYWKCGAEILSRPPCCQRVHTSFRKPR